MCENQILFLLYFLADGRSLLGFATSSNASWQGKVYTLYYTVVSFYYRLYTDKKNFLIYKEIQKGVVAKPYKGLLIYDY
jgi:hypothetical protein